MDHTSRTTVALSRGESRHDPGAGSSVLLARRSKSLTVPGGRDPGEIATVYDRARGDLEGDEAQDLLGRALPSDQA